MQGNRLERVNHLIQMELGKIFLHKMKDPRIGMVTVTAVKTAPDLRTARVYYSVLGSDDQKYSTGKAIEKGSGFIQRELGSVLEMRYTPKLQFILDESFAYGNSIDSVLNKIQKEKTDEA